MVWCGESPWCVRFPCAALMQAAGLEHWSSSDGVLVDPTPPFVVGEWFIDGTDVYLNRDFFSDGVIEAQWLYGFYDPESFISHYVIEVELVTDTSEQTVYGPVYWGDQAYAQIKGLELTHKSIYRVSITAFNYAGGSGKYHTPGSMFDATPPETEDAVVIDGSQLQGEFVFRGEDMEWMNGRVSLFGTWSGFTDPESGIWYYHINALDVDGVPMTEWFVVSGGQTEGFVRTPGLQHGETYYFAVRALNFAGNTATLLSNGVRIDRTPPVATTQAHYVVNGSVSSFMTSPSASVSVAWGVEDPESGVRVICLHAHSALAVACWPFFVQPLTPQHCPCTPCHAVFSPACSCAGVSHSCGTAVCRSELCPVPLTRVLAGLSSTRQPPPTSAKCCTVRDSSTTPQLSASTGPVMLSHSRPRYVLVCGLLFSFFALSRVVLCAGCSPLFPVSPLYCWRCVSPATHGGLFVTGGRCGRGWQRGHGHQLPGQLRPVHRAVALVHGPGLSHSTVLGCHRLRSSPHGCLRGAVHGRGSGHVLFLDTSEPEVWVSLLRCRPC